MNLILTRLQYRQDGIFGNLKDESGNVVCVTLEHSYNSVPKLADGTFTCKRGMHLLEGMARPFEAFEVLNVPPFEGKPVTGILFHVGNFNSDSCGCILVGKMVSTRPDGSLMIASSRETFASFMAMQSGVDAFTLVVR